MYFVSFSRSIAEYNWIAVIREYAPTQHPITPDNITRIHKRNSLFLHRAPTFFLFPPGGLSVVLLQLALASTLLLTLSLLSVSSLLVLANNFSDFLRNGGWTIYPHYIGFSIQWSVSALGQSSCGEVCSCQVRL